MTRVERGCSAAHEVPWQQGFGHWAADGCSGLEHAALNRIFLNFGNYFTGSGRSLLSIPTFLTYQRVSKRQYFGLTFTIASKEYNALSILKSIARWTLYKVQTMGLSQDQIKRHLRVTM